MERITITADAITTAKDYMPIAEKEKWAAETAAKCFDKLAISTGTGAMPPMYAINTGLKSRYLMAVLVGYYLGQDYEPDAEDAALISEADYDKWAGGHVLNEIERWKSEPSIRNKCFDILSDYRDLEKRLSAQISGLLAVQNDPVLRQTLHNAASLQDLPKVLEQLRDLQKGAT